MFPCCYIGQGVTPLYFVINCFTNIGSARLRSIAELLECVTEFLVVGLIGKKDGPAVLPFGL